MGIYEDQVLPHLIHWVMSTRAMMKVRQRALARASGAVLEIGFGSGLNLSCYPGAVTELKAVEPSERARRIAAPAIAKAPFPVELVGLDGQQLPVASDTMDCAVSTWTLCTIPDAAQALREVARVLKPGGQLLFVEHGLSPDVRVARWQHRLDGVEGFFAGGCHLNRDMEALLRDSPLRLESLERFDMPGPRTHTHMYLGVALKPA